jgi:transposase InsO family protein
MIRLLLAFLSWLGAFFRSRHDLGLELIALRQQVGVLKRKNPRPRLSLCDRLFWLGLRRGWSKWASVLVVVKPETVVGWHRTGLRCYWRFLSRRCPGRPKVTTELRHLIRSMAAENPTWGAPRIHGELLKLGFEVSESTVSRYLAQGASPRDSGQRWLTFLKNHREAIAAMDLFTAPTGIFRVLYCFFVIPQGRRKILHFNVTEHPTGPWIVQELREAFPENRTPQYLILDRDVKFSGEVATMLEYLGGELIRTAYRSPWQNPYVERLVGSVRRECLDHIVVFSELSLRRTLKSYFDYYLGSRTHLSLDKGAPEPRAVQPCELGTAVEIPQVGGLYHRYDRRAA